MKDQEKKKLLPGKICKGNGEEDRDPSDRSRPQHAVTIFSKSQRILSIVMKEMFQSGLIS